MKDNMLLLNILEDNAIAIKEEVEELIRYKVIKKLEEAKKKIAESIQLDEGNILRQGRTMIIRRRIRNGKMQKNIRRPTAKGFTIRGGKLKRIPAAQQIKNRITQKKASRKRRVKLQASLRKRKISMKKRSALGLKEHYNGL